MANLSSAKICILYPWSRFFSFEILNKLPKAGYKNGLQQLHKFNGIFKEFQNIMVEKKKLSMFALGSLGRQNMYLCSSTKLKTKGNFILIKITFNINF